MPQLLLEDAWPFRPDRTKIHESKEGSVKMWRVPGTLSLCDVPNGNNRVYPRRVWESNLKDGSTLMTLISQRAAFGTLEHPKDGVVDLSSPISHMVVEAKLSADGVVSGDILILDTEEGNKLKILIEAGYNPLVSSRGYGSVEKRADGKDEVKEDFICEGWDVVIRPSFGNKAQLTPQRENQATPNLASAATVALAEAQQRPAGSVKSEQTPIPTMDLKTIRPLIESLRAMDPKATSPQVLAEGFARISEAHNALAEIQAADPKAAWSCTQAHTELTKIEESWNSAIEGQRKQVQKLTEDRLKLIAVGESTAKTARVYREQLTEEVKRHQATKKLSEQILERGRGWKTHADKQTEQVKVLEHQLEVASLALEMLADMVKGGKKLQEKLDISCIANDMLAKQLVTETSDLARKLVESQLGDKLSADGKKKLDEAVTAAEILEVKKSLTEAAPAANTPPAAPAAAPAATPAAGNPPNQPVVKVSEGVQILQSGPVNSASITESLAIAARMRVAVKA